MKALANGAFMNLNFLLVSVNIIAVVITLPCASFSNTKECDQTEDVTFITNDIFDLTDDRTIFLHGWANFFHIKTKEKTLLNESTFFLTKCQIEDDDLQELERHLRSKKYIRDASVKFDEKKSVVVEVWDNWSLMPTVDFGRKGGSNTFAFGIKDRNLFGLGIDADVEYFNNNQRTGYKFDTQFPLFLKNNINASIRISNNDDGRSEAVFLQKKFVGFNTKNAYRVGFNNFNQIDTQYKNSTISNQYFHKKKYSTTNWHWLRNNSSDNTLRFGLGYTREAHTFSYLTDVGINPVSSLPTNRDFNYPFVAIRYLQKDYRKLTNLNLINQMEDFNLGWDLNASLGSGFSNDTGSPALIWQSNLSKGLNITDSAFFFFNAEFEGEQYESSNDKNRFLLKVNAEYIHKLNNRWGTYFKNSNQFSQNQFLDSPVVLGGESGVRGFPLQYRHGDHSIQFTFEARYYPHINIYNLLELAGAVFVDTGKVFSQSELSENQSSWLTSVGFGARFYSTHSSEGRVIHIDIIKPITSDSNVNNIEFRVTTKHSF